MDQVFRGQKLDLAIDMKQSLADVTSQSLMYKKPDGTTGRWTSGVSKSGTTLTYSIPRGELDQEGFWVIQGEVYVNNDRYPGAPVVLDVEEPLDSL